ncbi:hypothetical protein HXX76_005810 [Chlamydomonas incerta]|uniref:EGF-like domain-containing protein n=1 Tax=Chlamydomonas incerta TaxID=51695 RepID=A0A835W7B1_CHLIN|nr:hypothetical protein HXX76_005810 [Chlamydomonas incerta]|eukprot:KAG2438206.1 hypothetical protein HXX76_005810 [Chlamydomonas incerta]
MESSSGRRLMLQGRRAADDNAQSSSSSPTRGGLHQVCVVSGADTSSGSSSSGSCKCAPGMQMAPNSTCVDVNECEASPDICGVSGTCTNTAPGYACACGGASVLAEADGVLGGTCVGNIAAGRPAYASSSASEDSGPDKAVDGLTDATAAPLFHTLLDGRTWISLDLGGVARISRFRIWNRADCCGYRLRDAELRVGNTSLTSPSTTNLSAIFPTLVWKQQPPATGAATGEVLDVALEQPVAARWVTLQNFNSRSGDGYLALRELQVFGRLIISQPIAQASKRQPPVMPVPENTDGGGSGAGAAGKKKRRSKSPSPSPNPSPSPSPNARKRTRGGVPPSPAPT